jgi:hypothetical protein
VEKAIHALHMAENNIKIKQREALRSLRSYSGIL